MRVTTVTYSRLRALKQFENERLEMTAEVAEDEDLRIVYERLRGLVHRLLLVPQDQGLPWEDDGPVDDPQP